jgi:hypothetical protein
VPTCGVMRSITECVAAIGLVLLSIYCTFGLLFTAGGRDAGGIWPAFMGWVGAVGSAVAVWQWLLGKPLGYWLGSAVYFVGAISYLVAGAFFKFSIKDRIFVLTLAVINGLGFFAFYHPVARSRTSR